MAATASAAKKKGTSAVAAAIAEAATTFLFNSTGKDGGKNDATFTVLPVSKIHVIKGFNPRKRDLDEEAVNELRKTMKSGLRQPIIVRPHPDKVGEYAIVAGERRYRAAKAEEWKTIPATVREYDDELDAQADAVLENSDDVRKELSYMDLGRQFLVFQKAKWELGDIAKKTGYHISKVRRCLDAANAAEKGDPDLKKKLEGGMSMIAGLKYASLDETVRAKIKDKVDEDTSAAQIAALAKEASRGVEHQPGKKANAQKTKTARNAALIVWKQARTKQSGIADLAKLVWETDKSIDRDLKIHLLGALAHALWDRGDLDAPYIGFSAVMFDKKGELVQTPEGEMEAEEKKAYKKLVLLIKVEMKKAEAAEPAAEEVAEPATDAAKPAAA